MSICSNCTEPWGDGLEQEAFPSQTRQTRDLKMGQNFRDSEASLASGKTGPDNVMQLDKQQ